MNEAVADFSGAALQGTAVYGGACDRLYLPQADSAGIQKPARASWRGGCSFLRE